MDLMLSFLFLSFMISSSSRFASAGHAEHGINSCKRIFINEIDYTRDNPNISGKLMPY